MPFRARFRRLVKRTLQRARVLPPDTPSLRDVEEWKLAVVAQVGEHTMTPANRVVELCAAVAYVEANSLPGAFVECGVARGGSVMAMALSLMHIGRCDREIYAFDTYEGQPRPSSRDADLFRPSWPVEDQWRDSARGRDDPDSMFHGPLEAVQARVASTGYPQELVHYIKGMVEDTLPAQAPDRIALLRLDTDWYESTRHELEHLYPALVPGGVLIVDDYGQYAGASLAVDEYFADRQILLTRIDESARIAVKQG